MEVGASGRALLAALPVGMVPNMKPDRALILHRYMVEGTVRETVSVLLLVILDNVQVSLEMIYTF